MFNWIFILKLLKSNKETTKLTKEQKVKSKKKKNCLNTENIFVYLLKIHKTALKNCATTKPKRRKLAIYINNNILSNSEEPKILSHVVVEKFKKYTKG